MGVLRKGAACLAALWRWHGRPPHREPLLTEIAARLAEIGLRNVPVPCQRCTGTGHVAAVVLAWTKPIRDGGRRERHNVHASCLGCWRDTGRNDGLPVLEGARLHQRRTPKSDAVIICT